MTPHWCLSTSMLIRRGREESVFAPTHKTFLVRADEALPPTAGTPGTISRPATALV
ncbi:Hypothetical protein SMAX5B_003624 [Scophthalmus maximus]|uniref:Uncharacterized protein n=1 Tax=Scophthalmus maximus TaxID=52904 RepID=A0A2U9CKL9_SCOMX|nr:Hypothetical protein SMAX5B_003624 [Scophthalmus maximus]